MYLFYYTYSVQKSVCYVAGEVMVNRGNKEKGGNICEEKGGGVLIILSEKSLKLGRII